MEDEAYADDDGSDFAPSREMLPSGRMNAGDDDEVRHGGTGWLLPVDWDAILMNGGAVH